MSAARQVKAKAVKRRPLIRAASSAAIASGSRHVSLLVPSAGLPPEGEEFEWPVSFRPTGEFRQWIDVFRALCGDRAPRFHIRGTDVDLLSDLEDASVLHWVQMSFTEDDDLPQLEASPATACIDWSTVLGRVSERMHDPHFIPSPRELLRVFLEEMRAVVGVSARTFAGEGVPIVSISPGVGNNISISFYGVWQADVGELQSMRGALPVKSLQGGDLCGLDGCLLLNEAEVEGRGLMEAVMSLSMLAMVFQDPLNQPPPASPVSTSGSRQAENEDGHRFEELRVRSQKLRQPAPRLYPSVLRDAEGCEHKVVVDVAGQRAYVFIDNVLAFETPVSTASKGRHTPRGIFKITEKIRSGKRSTLYKSLMPYWMRLDQTAIGMHTGPLPGYPASHGCVRMPDESARFIFELVPKGTVVQIVDSLRPQRVEDTAPVVAKQ